MRKLIVSMFASLDGYVETEAKELDWFVFDDQMEKYIEDLMDSVDLILLGRIAYESLAPYWQSQRGPLAERMNHAPKLVFSRTLESVGWNARLARNAAEEVGKLKAQPGKDIVLFAGAGLASSLQRLDLVDEYRIVVNPVILGRGRPLFAEIAKPFSVALKIVQPFSCGNVLMHYGRAL